MEDANPDYSLFWCQVIPKGSTVSFDAPVSKNITITNAVIPDVTSETPKNPVRVMAKVQTLKDDGEEEDENNKKEGEEEEQQDAAYTENTFMVCSLLPFERENQQLNILFTPLSTVEFQNQGELDVHLSGVITPLDNEEEEVEEEDEEEQKAEGEQKEGNVEDEKKEENKEKTD